MRHLDARAVVAVPDRVRRARHALAHAERRARAAHERRLAAPSSPETVTTSPGTSRAASSAASASVSSGELVSTPHSVKSGHACIRDRRDRDLRPGAVRAVQGRLARARWRPAAAASSSAAATLTVLEGDWTPTPARRARVPRPRHGRALVRVRGLPGGEAAPRGRRTPEHGRGRRRLRTGRAARRATPAATSASSGSPAPRRLGRAPEQLRQPREVGLRAPSASPACRARPPGGRADRAARRGRRSSSAAPGRAPS